jgi:hypothetical protein
MYWRTTHKFGCRLPHSVEEALEIDRQTGTDHWQRALNREMSTMKFDQGVPVNWQNE